MVQIRGDARDRDDAAAVAGQHAGQRGLGHSHRRANEHPDQLLFVVDRGVQEVGAQPEAGVVDQDVDGPALVGGARLDGRTALVGTEVGEQHLDVDMPCGAQLGGLRVEALAIAGNDHQIVAELRVPLGELRRRCPRSSR